MRDGTNIRFGENCADVLTDLHQGRLEQLDDDHHDDDNDGGGGGADQAGTNCGASSQQVRPRIISS